MFRKAAALGLVAGVFASAACAQNDRIKSDIPHLDHVFLIMMENHGYQQVIGNPNEPYLNSLIASVRSISRPIISPSDIPASQTIWKS
jgi:hypothetical protein